MQFRRLSLWGTFSRHFPIALHATVSDRAKVDADFTSAEGLSVLLYVMQSQAHLMLLYNLLTFLMVQNSAGSQAVICITIL